MVGTLLKLRPRRHLPRGFILVPHNTRMDLFFRDHRSLFPENRRPPPGLDSCVSGNGFCALPPGSRATLEGGAAESDALRRFLGVSRPLRTISGEKSCGPTFFRHQAGRCFCNIPVFSKRAKRSKKAIQIPKSKFRYLDHFAVGGRGLITSVR